MILEAAEIVARRSGQGGLRLVEVAAEAGVSHPTILHHFESRDGLIQALNRRTFQQLGDRLREQIERPHGTMADIINDAFATYRGGLAQRIIWALEISEAPQSSSVGQELFGEMAKHLHDLRCAFCSKEMLPILSDSEAIVHLITIAAFGEAIIGSRLPRTAAGDDDRPDQRGFEVWLTRLISRHIHAPQS